MVLRTDQSIKPYRSLRDRARQAHEAELESEAAERAEALARAQRNMAATLAASCQRLFHLTIDPAAVEVEIRANETTFTRDPAGNSVTLRNPFVIATAIVESIRFSAAMRAADAAKVSGQTPLGSLFATPLCPVCGSELALYRPVTRLAELGRLLGEVGCGCGWTPAS